MFDFLKIDISLSDIAKWLHSIFKLPYPKKTIKIINRDNSNWWSEGTKGNKPAMQVVGDWYLTNITDNEVLICRVEVNKPKTIGNIFVKHPKNDIYGNYVILPHCTTDARTDFWIQPLIREKGETYKTSVIFTDQFGNRYNVKNILFPSLKK